MFSDARSGRAGGETVEASAGHVDDTGGRKVIFRHALALYPYFSGSTAAMGIFPPTGLEYVAASMEGLVGKVTFLDLRYETEYQDIERLCAFIRGDVDLLCISIPWASRFDRVLDLVRQLPSGITTVVGGHTATEEVDTIFQRCPNVGMVVRGEGEEIIRKLVSGEPVGQIAGLSYRRGDDIVHNPNGRLPDVAGLRFPDRSLRRQRYRWFQEGIRLTDATFDAVLTARGCPYKCRFCTFSLNPLGQKREYTERPLESVIEELKTVTADIVMFSDDNFFANPKRSEALCDLIIRSGIRKTFLIQARIEAAKHPAMLARAAAAGIRLILIGIESPHDRILKQINKGFTQQDVRDAMKVLLQYPFYLHGYFIYGNIGETEDEMMYIPTFAREVGLDSITFQKLRIEKHSPLRDLVLSTPGYHFDHVGGPVYSDRYNLSELKRIRNAIRREFYGLAQVRHAARKLVRLGLMSRRDVLRGVCNLPRFAYVLTKREIRKAWPRRAVPVRVA
jgi:anaerobic magnesium-protoporphyrin IX monomethyl ester cyclase